MANSCGKNHGLTFPSSSRKYFSRTVRAMRNSTSCKRRSLSSSRVCMLISPTMGAFSTFRGISSVDSVIRDAGVNFAVILSVGRSYRYPTSRGNVISQAKRSSIA